MTTTNLFFRTEITKRPHWSFWVVSFAILAGLALSILSWMEICVEHCSANQVYRLFGLPFAVVGMTFFSGMALAQFLSLRHPGLRKIVSWAMAAAFGSEIMFIAIQKYQIGHWCPVCISIAFVVGASALIIWMRELDEDLIKQPKTKDTFMTTLRHAMTSLTFIIGGFLMAFIGVTKPDLAEAAMNNMKDRIAFGTKNSPIEVYFVTDWFCPSCRKIEPLIEKVYPKLAPLAGFYFVDYQIHANSQNFIPYNLAFMINDKKDYFEARNSLTALARENETPNDSDIAAIAKKHGLLFRELPYSEVNAGNDFFKSIISKYDLKATPTLIITNTKNNKTVKLEGTDEITESAISKGIESVKK